VRILVTGGAGFIGSEYVRTLLKDSYESTRVTVLDKLTYAGNRANLDPVATDSRLTFVQGDICDTALVDDLMPGHDAVVHFAAETHVDRAVTGPATFVQTNVVGTHTLLDAAVRHRVGRFLHVSTDEVYGSIEEGTWTEETLLAPRSAYSAAKAGSDLLALAYPKTYGLDVVVTRCSNNYGHYQFPEKVVPLFITNLLNGKHVPLYGDGLNIRDWLHVSDHVQGINLVLAKGRSGEVYHIGGGTELTNRELTALLLDACGADWSMVEPVADRPGHDRRYSLSIEKIRNELGYEPAVSLADGLAATVAWYRDNRAWWEPLMARAALTTLPAGYASLPQQ
jgi:dTDP-glucose 4,6-dehydratase